MAAHVGEKLRFVLACLSELSALLLDLAPQRWAKARRPICSPSWIPSRQAERKWMPA